MKFAKIIILTFPQKCFYCFVHFCDFDDFYTALWRKIVFFYYSYSTSKHFEHWETFPCTIVKVGIKERFLTLRNKVFIFNLFVFSWKNSLKLLFFFQFRSLNNRRLSFLNESFNLNETTTTRSESFGLKTNSDNLNSKNAKTGKKRVWLSLQWNSLIGFLNESLVFCFLQKN